MISFAGSDPTSALFVIQGVTFNLIRRVKKKEMARGVGTIVQERQLPVIVGHLYIILGIRQLSLLFSHSFA